MRRLSLFLFIDAFGWKIHRRHPLLLADRTREARPLRTILGYSSACDPSIISGLPPAEHGLWSSFYYAPGSCPYRWLRHLRFLPRAITSRARFRHILSRAVARMHRFTGYFQLYNVPFELLPLFDYAEKRRIWEPGGLPRGRSIFDMLHERRIPYCVHDSAAPDPARLDALLARIAAGDLRFAYVSFGALDALMHRLGTRHPRVEAQIRWYDTAFRRVLDAAAQRYDDVGWHVFTDHGMRDVETTVDLQSAMASTGLAFGRDYVAFYDATMARFWLPSPPARRAVESALRANPCGRIVPDEELRALGVLFPDRRYGDLIFLCNPGVQIVPSFMGPKANAGMHGYHPDDAHSAASLLTNRALPADITEIRHIHRLMLRELGWEEDPTARPNAS